MIGQRSKKLPLPDKIEDMVEGVIYRPKNGYNAYILIHCEDCAKPMSVKLSYGKPQWIRCRDCENKRRLKYPLLPDNIEDMKDGVIYKDKWSAACILEHCKVCGVPLIIRLDQLETRKIMCHPCSNRTDEKREIMSEAHKGIPMSEGQKIKQSLRMKDKWANDLDFKTHLMKTSFCNIGRVVTEETKEKLRKANKGQRPSEKCIIAREKRMKELYSDETWMKSMREKLINSRKNISPEVEKERCRKIGISSQERWDNPIEAQKFLDGFYFSPTKPEKYLDNLLQTHFPNLWRFNGDNSQKFTICYKIPDFIPCQDCNSNKVIELFSYHHCPALFKKVSKDRMQKGRIELFKKFGYETLIIWEQELGNTESVINKVKEFMRAS